MSFNYTSTGGALPKTYSIESGALPTGISLNTSTAALTGTFTTEGTFNWVVKVVDANGMETTLPDTCIVSAAPFSLRGVAWNQGSKQVTVWQGDTDVVTATISVPEVSGNILTNISDCRIKSDGTKAYVLSRGDNALYEVDLVTNTAVSLVTGLTDGNSLAMTRDGQFAYVLGGATDQIFKVDIPSAAIVASPTFAGFVFRCELSPDEDFLYVGSTNSPLKVRKIDTATMAVSATSTADVITPEDMSVSADGGVLYVIGSHPGDNDLTAFDTSDMSVAASANFTEPFSVLADDSGTYVYLLHSAGGLLAQVSKLDATTLASVGSVAAGNARNAKMAFSYDYTRIFIGDSDAAGTTDPVLVVDPITMTTLTPVAANENPSGVAASGTVTVLGYNGVALAIPDNNGFVSSNIVVSGESPANQTNLAITMNLTHSYRGDLEIIIDKPDGGSVTLVSPDENDNLRNFVRSFALGPSALLVNGTWTLRIRDTVAADVGTLNYWKVIKTSA